MWFAISTCRVVVEEAELLSIGIFPEGRCLGWGRPLLSAVLAEARSTGAETIVLEVAEGNEEAQTLYDALGFVRVGRREIYCGSGAGRRIAADYYALQAIRLISPQFFAGLARAGGNDLVC